MRTDNMDNEFRAGRARSERATAVACYAMMRIVFKTHASVRLTVQNKVMQNADIVKKGLAHQLTAAARIMNNARV